MPEVIHFRESDAIIKQKDLEADVNITLEYVEAMLHGTLYKRELTIQALKECDWREGDLSILDGRRYQYKGFKKGVAIEGNFAAYEYILEGLFRLQIGFDKGRIETGILMLTSERSEKSRLGTSIELAKWRSNSSIRPYRCLSRSPCLIWERPELPDENSVKGGETDGVSVQAPKTLKNTRKRTRKNANRFRDDQTSKTESVKSIPQTCTTCELSWSFEQPTPLSSSKPAFPVQAIITENMFALIQNVARPLLWIFTLSTGPGEINVPVVKIPSTGAPKLMTLLQNFRFGKTQWPTHQSSVTNPHAH